MFHLSFSTIIINFVAHFNNLKSNIMRITLSLIGLLFLMVSCHSGQNSGAGNKNKEGIHTAVVQEVLQAGQYTYLKVKEGEDELWIAVNAVQAEVGKTYYYKDGMEMKNFHSKELNRDFPIVYFINEISSDAEMKTSSQAVAEHGQMGGMNNQSGMTSGKPVVEKQDVKVTPAAGGITIGDLYAKKDKYSGKSVKITGKVVKFNPEIMNKNWIHIQDGTDNKGDFDLTVTTTATVKVGDVITVEGKVSLDKDFGAGYLYKVIVEDASVK
jgi:hypothetical protein